jgi:ornithine cyclodeaminase/alanine dehydrogenase-like protein (mu-crystallin family)
MHSRAGGEFYAMPAPGAPVVQAQLLATHIPSGRVLALMGAEWITALRTAAVIGCGLQARTHLGAWQDAFALRQVLAHSRRSTSAAAFAAEARACGVTAQVLDTAAPALSSGARCCIRR